MSCLLDLEIIYYGHVILVTGYLSFDMCQLTISWMSNDKNARCKQRLHVSVYLLLGVE